jgi:hypothetical protein
MLSLYVLESDSTVNHFSHSTSKKFASGEDVKIRLRLWQPTKDIRYIPEAGAIITVELTNSDKTTLTKTLTHPFADDRSVVEFELSAAETAQLISQALVVEISEGSKITYAILQNALQKTPLAGGCGI